MSTATNRLDHAFDEISSVLRKTVPSQEFALVDIRVRTKENINRTYEKLATISFEAPVEADRDLISAIVFELKETLSDAAQDVKGRGQEIGGRKGSEIEDMADALFDFLEEDFDDLFADLIPED